MKKWAEVTLHPTIVKEMTYVARVHPMSVSRKDNRMFDLTLCEQDQERLAELGYAFVKAIDEKTAGFLAFGRITGSGWYDGRSASYFYLKVKEL